MVATGAHGFKTIFPVALNLLLAPMRYSFRTPLPALVVSPKTTGKIFWTANPCCCH